MKKVVTILQKGDEDPNIEYWRSLSSQERITNLEKIRQEVIKAKYGNERSPQESSTTVLEGREPRKRTRLQILALH